MKAIFTLLLLSCLAISSKAQTLEISPGGNQPECPGNIVSYNTYIAGGPISDYSGCSFKWSITKGKFFTTNSSEDLITVNNSVSVIWDDVTQKGSLSVVLTGCKNTSLNVSRSINIIIKSINGVGPSQVKVNGTSHTSYNLNWCSTAPVTLSIDRIKIPNTPSQSNPVYNTQLYVDMYEWTLPAGWRTSSNQTDTFITTDYSITVIPAAGQGGSVKVRGYNYECSASSSWS